MGKYFGTIISVSQIYTLIPSGIKEFLSCVLMLIHAVLTEISSLSLWGKNP